MKYYDLNIKGNSYEQNKELILEGHRLGWDYFNILFNPEKYEVAIKYKDQLIAEINDILTDIEYHKREYSKREIYIEFGIEVRAKNQNEVYKIPRKYREKTKFIAVLGGDLGINRAVCENRQIDILSRPYLKQRTCGINHVLAKEARKNNVAIELCFNDISSSYLSYRAKIMAHFREIIKLYQKFRFPLIITTGSSSIWDIKSPRDIFAVFKSLGLTEDDLNKCFFDYPNNIVKFNNERENMVILGVKKIDKDKEIYKNIHKKDNMEDKL
ncbi:ribonuclease P subunit P30 [Methanobrevibacter sp. TMH8]|uniref:ribonuclease P protein component 3 n=1 Tax=Methanobrevibacter sp. TMH8 TaxID=2848611 RepID=UPI001CCF619A|nr:RNase P subunit p30 family protein [Methanobrevibacter sp. TMH8]MBZ9571350.1 ribonuclease P subunit P30 [Methanobrevibacter sp. TMH8]